MVATMDMGFQVKKKKERMKMGKIGKRKREREGRWSERGLPADSGTIDSSVTPHLFYSIFFENF